MAWEAARAARSCVPEPLSTPELTGSDAVATVSGVSVQPSICRHALPGPPCQGLGMTLFAQSWTPCRDSIDPSVPTEPSKASSDGRPLRGPPRLFCLLPLPLPRGSGPHCDLRAFLLSFASAPAPPSFLSSASLPALHEHMAVKWVAAHNSSLECLSSGAGSPTSRCQ